MGGEANMSWVDETDVVVLGSGGAGLAAAIVAHDEGARVVVLEKGQLIGGTTATSGGILWVPNNPHMAALGIEDTEADALAYLESLSLGVMDMTLARTFIREAPNMIRYLESNTALGFHVAAGYPDYHPENPGGKPQGGRSLDPDLFSFKRLGPWAERVNRLVTDLHPQAPVVPITLVESMGKGLPDSETLAARIADDTRGMGQALIGALLEACLQRDIPLHTGVRARELVQDNGSIVGVIAERNGSICQIRARRGVIIATGGFEWNSELVASFLRGPLHGPASPPENEGDGLLMAMAVGASLGNMSEAWWMPTIPIPGEHVRGRPLYRLCLAERTLPGSIMVNGKGRRFANEAANYNDIGRAFHTFDPTRFAFENNPAWLIFDDVYQRRYPVAGYAPGKAPPGLLHTASDIAALASMIDVDANALKATLERFNQYAAEGRDPDFDRGVSAYDTYNGDRTQPGVSATLRPLSDGPYHAVRIVSGALGTKGGPRTDDRARVLDTRGQPIPGLYAAGNAMAGSTGMVYGGAGGTLGPALTFGYLAGKDAAHARTGRND
jgi:succinate dehydrogenase/fumarate reductase flavoprotein subunit